MDPVRKLLWQMRVAEWLIVFAISTAVGYIVWAAVCEGRTP